MKKVLGGLSLLTVLVVSLFAMPLRANSSKPFRRAVTTPLYDAAKEVTLEGRIEEVVEKPAPGRMLGGHLMVSTQKGVIDAHIGGFVLRGPHAYAPAAGQSVKLTGVMISTARHQEIFLTRTIESGDRTIQVRTKRGYLIAPGTKEHVGPVAAAGGAR